MSQRDRSTPLREEAAAELSRVHLRIGWWALLFFLSAGAALESMHGFKLGFYLDVSNEVRRLTWTLAHAHGSLLAILNLVFAATLPLAPQWSDSSRVVASRCLIGALILLPMGFLLGGIFVHGGDPGLGVLLVPPGAALLFVAVLLAARGMGKSKTR
jgi:hypothetical protein